MPDFGFDGWKRELNYRSGRKEERRGKPKQKFTLPSKACSITIGRSSNCDLRIDEDKKLSREHCKITSTDGMSFTFIDLGSSGGSKINRKLTTKAELHDGDSIKVG